jgi:type I restriction enzyme M protein
LAAVKKQQKAMQQEFITQLGKARAELSADQERDLVLRLAKNDLATHLDGYVTVHRQQIITALETWWEKYTVSLRQTESERDAATSRLAEFLKELGYE